MDDGVDILLYLNLHHFFLYEAIFTEVQVEAVEDENETQTDKISSRLGQWVSQHALRQCL